MFAGHFGDIPGAKGEEQRHEGISAWDSAEAGNGLFPRIPQPNTVLRNRKGQCVLSSPTKPGGPPGPGPF